MRDDEAVPRANTQKSIVFYLSAVGVALFVVRVVGAEWSSKFGPYFPDSFSYLDVASRGPFRPFDERPFLYPSYLWLTGRNTQLAVLGQTLAYAAAFLVLVAVAWRSLSSRVAAVVVTVLVLAIAIQPRYALWNTQILSEGPALILAVASITAWWMFCAHPSPRRAVWAWVWTVLWICVRDSHVVPVLTVVVPTVVIATLLWRGIDHDVRRRLLAGAVVVVAVSGVIYVAQDTSNRNNYPFHNNIGLRVLPDPALTRWFVDGGMPLDDALRARTGRDSWNDEEAFLRAPELEGYREWAEGRGSRRFLLSLLVQFPEWYDRLTTELPTMLGDDRDAYDTYGVRHRLPSRIPLQLGGPESNGSLVAWTSVAVAGLAAALLATFRRRAPAALVIFAGAGLLSAFVDIYASYAGDAVEVSRHLVGPTLRLGVMLAICVGIGIDAVDRLVPTRVRADGVEVAGAVAGEETSAETR